MRELEVRTHLRIMKQSLLANELRGFSRSDVDKVLGNDVAKVISNWTSIPVDKMTEDESDRLLKMEEIATSGKRSKLTSYFEIIFAIFAYIDGIDIQSSFRLMQNIYDCFFLCYIIIIIISFH